MSGFASEQNLYERLKLAPNKPLANVRFEGKAGISVTFAIGH